jgi:dihydroxyacetone kinase-like protein
LIEIVRHVALEVAGAADELNRLDAAAGDGDLGVTMRLASSAVLDALPEVMGKPVADVLRACGSAIARNAASTGGTLIAIALLRASTAAGQLPPETPPVEAFALVLTAAADGIADRGKATVGSKTMLDALVPAADAVSRCSARGDSLEMALQEAAKAADLGADATRSMRAVHGRAGWLADRSEGHEDAGARLVAIAFRAAASGVDDSAVARTGNK